MRIFPPPREGSWSNPVELLPLNLATLNVAEDLIGVREVDTNWGPEIQEFLAAVDIEIPAPWCAAYVNHCAEVAAAIKGVMSPLEQVPLQGYVQSYVETADALGWMLPYQEVGPGDLFALHFPSLDRFGHIGFVAGSNYDGTYKTVEGNTNRGGSREGIMVADRIREVDGGTVFMRWC